VTRARGFVIAAPASGAGKSTVTVGLLRAYRDAGVRVAAAKCGPDYIDPMHHAVACGAPSVNLDPWAMDAGTLTALARTQAAEAELLVVEGVMGLFDGARDGTGSTADLAAALGLPVIFLVDASHQAQSLAALVHGFNSYRGDVRIAGVIFNHVGQPSHAAMIEAALRPLGIPVLGSIPRDAGFAIPSRHLGLVPAAEVDELEATIERLAARVAERVDLKALEALSAPLPEAGRPRWLSPPGHRVAVASDIAFCFAYPHLLVGWRGAGAELSFFSPLADEPPAAEADAIYLPGGYPELHAPALAAADRFRNGVREAARRGTRIYGECGGYMALGDGLTSADGAHHRMLGLLPLETSFAVRKLHLGYRRLAPLPGAPWAGGLLGHEFHYATILKEEGDAPLFEAATADGRELPPMGRRTGAVAGSFAHLIGPA
jgi:cobyrinic acid a,c-diamide synthase